MTKRAGRLNESRASVPFGVLFFWEKTMQARAAGAAGAAGAVGAAGSGRECVVCMVAECVTRFYPCQHSVCCGACAAHTVGKKCVMCSSVVRTITSAGPLEPMYIPPTTGPRVDEAAWRAALTVSVPCLWLPSRLVSQSGCGLLPVGVRRYTTGWYLRGQRLSSRWTQVTWSRSTRSALGPHGAWR